MISAACIFKLAALWRNRSTYSYILCSTNKFVAIDLVQFTTPNIPAAAAASSRQTLPKSENYMLSTPKVSHFRNFC